MMCSHQKRHSYMQSLNQIMRPLLTWWNGLGPPRTFCQKSHKGCPVYRCEVAKNFGNPIKCTNISHRLMFHTVGRKSCFDTRIHGFDSEIFANSNASHFGDGEAHPGDCLRAVVFYREERQGKQLWKSRAIPCTICRTLQEIA